MSVTPSIASLTMAIVLAAGVGGCAGQQTAAADKNTYVRQINAAQTRFADSVRKVSAQASSPSQYRRTLESFRAAVGGLVGTLRSIRTPVEARAAHGRLIATMSAFGREIAVARSSIVAVTPQVIGAVQRRVSAAIVNVNARIGSAVAAINARLAGG